MAPEPVDRTSPTPQGEPRQALWPWLLLPLAALALFFLLYKLRHASMPVLPEPAATSAEPAETR